MFFFLNLGRYLRYLGLSKEEMSDTVCVKLWKSYVYEILHKDLSVNWCRRWISGILNVLKSPITRIVWKHTKKSMLFSRLEHPPSNGQPWHCIIRSTSSERYVVQFFRRRTFLYHEIQAVPTSYVSGIAGISGILIVAFQIRTENLNSFHSLMLSNWHTLATDNYPLLIASKNYHSFLIFIYRNLIPRWSTMLRWLFKLWQVPLTVGILARLYWMSILYLSCVYSSAPPRKQCDTKVSQS